LAGGSEADSSRLRARENVPTPARAEPVGQRVAFAPLPPDEAFAAAKLGGGGGIHAAIAKLLDAGILSRGQGRGRYRFVERLFAAHVRVRYLT
jgi:hypothetical protein